MVICLIGSKRLTTQTKILYSLPQQLGSLFFNTFNCDLSHFSEDTYTVNGASETTSNSSD